MFRISIADKFCDWGFILLALVILLSTSFRGSLLIVSFIDEFLPRYMYISSNDKVVRAKKGTGGLHLVKTVKTWSPSSFVFLLPFQNILTAIITCAQWTPIQVQAIIIASYAEPVTAEQCAVVTEKLGDYLVSVGYWTFLLHIFCQCLMFSFWTFFTNMSILDPLVIPVQYKFYNWHFMEEICLISRATKNTFLVSIDFWALQLISLDKHGVENLLLRNSAIDIFLWF